MHSHYCSTNEVLKTFMWLNHQWDQNFNASSHFMDMTMESLTLPCQLSDFSTLQESHIATIGEKFNLDWRRSFTEQLVDNVQDVYDFFQSDKKVYLASPLHRLFKHSELRMAQHLRETVEQSLTNWIQLIKQFSVEGEEANTDHLPSMASERGLSGKTSLIQTELVVTDDSLTLYPSPSEIEDALIGCVERMIEFVRSLTTVDSDLMSLLHLPPRIIFNVGQNEPTTQSCDALIAQCKAFITEKVATGTVQPQTIVEKYNTYFYLIEIDTDDYVETFIEGVVEKPADPENGIMEDTLRKPTTDEYFLTVRQFHDAAMTVQTMGFDQELFCLVGVNTAKAKSTLISKALEIRDAFLERMVSDIRDENLDITDEYENILSRVSEKPKDEVELSALRDFIVDSKATIDNLISQVDSVHVRISTMEEFAYPITQDDVNLMWGIKEYPRKVEHAAADALEALEADKVKMMDQLALEKEKFEHLLESFDADVKKVSLFANYEAMDQNVEAVNSLMDSVEKAQEQAENFNMREKVFGFPPTDYPGLIACKKELAPFHKLWNMISDFHLSRQEWLHGSFLELDANEIENNVTDWWKISYKMTKTLEDEFPGSAESAGKLRAVTTDFREHLPVIRSLASKALKDRHWDEISEKLGAHIEPDDELTLNALLELDVAKHIDEIQEVCVAAEKQYGLEKALDAMKVEWQSIEFVVKAYKETGTSVVGGVDDIVTLLDDHIVKTQTMRGSPFIKPIEQSCKDWEIRLKYAQGLIDEWVNCQRTWMYLEPIFSSDDIMRQLPTESKRYQGVDALWKKVMLDCNSEPNFMFQADPEKRLEEKFLAANKKLDEIQKGLADYLETKRLYFPRFFFLSNDELLEILSQTKDPRAVQPHLNKAFEGVSKVKLEKDLKITQMISAEGEKVDLHTFVDPEKPENKGNVEKWLLLLEYIHWETVLDLTKASLKEYQEIDRQEWSLHWPAQVILAVSQIYWTQRQEKLLNERGIEGMKEGVIEQTEMLGGIVKMVRGKISKIDRKTLGALTTIDVHARDSCVNMVASKVNSVTDFGWLSQLRYYWEKSWANSQGMKKGDNGPMIYVINKDENTVVARIVNAKALYGYEYLGNTMRLVITPLTDRCYRTMIGAIDLLYGGAPEGPAGTGKTETVKDLSKAVAIQCVVFNCSDGLDYLAMAKFFKGLAACGAWCCFDEFNRINVEVLSVIAQQILTIQSGKKIGLTKFQFEGSYITLNHNANPFITMNPGYAGRAELPDNLKALFRPCSMMVPDYAMISEIRLYSFGFEVARSNAQKLVKTLQLCSEQLSSQKHYDYGMRAVNSILVAAGNLREQLGENPLWDETKIVLRSVNDVNLAKFTVEDLPLFAGITSDLFPGVVLPESDYSDLQPAIINSCLQGVSVGPGRQFLLEPKPAFMRKIIELYEMVMVRHGLCVVGQTGSGKSVGTHVLAEAMSALREGGNENFKKTVIHTMNPKSVLSGQLYGNFDENTHEWSDGILAVIYRTCAKDTSGSRMWVLFDGPVDAVWIENMNTVLDDNKKLCLMSGEIVKMSDTMTMMFEAEDLTEASPATVSRLGIIFTETRNLGWQVLRNVWLKGLPTVMGETIPGGWEPHLDFISSLFDWLFPPALFFVEKFCRIPTPVTDMECCTSLIRFLECFLDAEAFGSDLEKCLEGLFLQALIWSVGAIIDSEGRIKFNDYIHAVIRNSDILKESAQHEEFIIKSPFYLDSLAEGTTERILNSLPCDTVANMYDVMFDPKKMTWINWLDNVDHKFVIPKDAHFSDIVVPTIDTIRHAELMHTLIVHNKHILVTGDTGTGKSVSVKNMLMGGLDNNYSSMFLNFSAQTKANATQDIIDSKLGKRRKGVFGPDFGTRCIIFVDDLNMPLKEEYGAQPPIEILRQWMDHCGWYDRKENVFREIVDIQFMAAMGPPGGGRTQITQRYVRHFNLINFVPFNDESLARVFATIVDWFFAKGFVGPVKQVGASLVQSTINVYNSISSTLLPTPAKSHYTFNLRDISKVFQGVLQCTPDNVKDKESSVRLWAHEVFRVFYDRLVNNEDRDWFKTMLGETTKEMFNLEWKRVMGGNDSLMYGNFLDPKPVVKPYVEIADQDKLRAVMDEYLEDYNMMTSRPMSLVLFQNAIEHVARISRIINQPSGNALLVGVGGSGRKSLSILATSIADFKLFQIEISKSYGMFDWREDIKTMMNIVGIENQQVVFLYDDTQIVYEAMLEDISGILNTGEVANLFNNEEMSMMIEALSKEANDEGVNTASQSEMYAYFIKRCKKNLHIVLPMSPIGDQFRTRLRMFPALVNCCTIDWFTEWPEEALRSVAKYFLGSIDMDDSTKQGAIDCCVNMQEKVSNMSVLYQKEMGRFYYVTPTSYLMLINTFKSLLNKQRTDVSDRKARYENGLTKILDTQEQVDVMQKELVALQPLLKEATIDTDKLLDHIAVDTKVANESKALVQKEEAICNEQAAEASAMAASCEADLAEALPALASAMKALKSLSKNDIVEVKAMGKPPAAVKMVMHAVCVLMSVKCDMIKDPEGGTKKVKDFWGPAKKHLLGDTRFLANLETYDKDNMTDEMVAEVKTFTDLPEFQPEIVKKGSVAAAGLCKWVHAMVVYHRVNKVVGPKKEALGIAKGQLASAQAELGEKQAQLKELMDKLAALQVQLDEAEAKKLELQNQVTDCSNKLKRAEQLITGLGGERDSWAIRVKLLGELYENVTGDVMLSSGAIAYLGAFTALYRTNAVAAWSELLMSKNINCSPTFKLSETLGDQVQIREWIINKLPNDSISIDNAIMLQRSSLWPLMIDPQSQANKWVKQSEGKNSLKVVKLTQATFVRTIENAIQFGSPVLLENVGESIDPILDPILQKQIVTTGGQATIRLGDSTVEYDPKFKLYMTTKLSNPHYPPELCVKVNLLNFMATLDGLEDQMLGVLVAMEEPELEAQRESLVLEDAQNQKQLKEIEDTILHLLKNAQGNILDDEVLIDTLHQSKITSNTIEEKVKVAAKTTAVIAKVRLSYKVVAYHASNLFFCISELANVDPMYQYSLEWFIGLFQNAIRGTPKTFDKDERVENLQNSFTSILYSNICRSLFAKDKLLFSFLLCSKIMLSRGLLRQLDLRFFLQGSTALELAKPNPAKGDESFLTDKMWMELIALSQTIAVFKGFDEKFANNLDQWERIYNSKTPMKDLEEFLSLGKSEEEKFSQFHLLIVLKCLRPDVVVPATMEFVAANIGKEFIEVPQFDLSLCFKDSTCSSPLIFVLTPGAAPMNELTKLADEMGFGGNKLNAISLGQGQGPIAEAAIQEAADKGTWVCLQNCHLSVSWMGVLERICEGFSADRVNDKFRLWLTSEPSKSFPVFILQNGVKMTVEPPKGMRANLLGSYYSIENDFFEGSQRPAEFKKMLFALAFFHATVRERKKFGPLGWNIQYVFSGPDLKISMDQLRIFVDDSVGLPVPYPALHYLTAECNYGGRVTDDKDRRCLANILDDFYNATIQDADRKFSTSGTYFAPKEGDIDSYKSYIESLPMTEGPEVFGLHENANISCALSETNSLLLTALSLQPKSLAGEGKGWAEILAELAVDIEKRLPGEFDMEKALLDFPVKYEEGMNTVLTQELIRFNRLTNCVSSTLKDVQRAIKGLVVMSGDLEEMGNDMVLSKVPGLWGKVSYPSLKPLGSWVNDLLQRLEFLGSWNRNGKAPSLYWVSGFFFTQAFITGTLQNYARKEKKPIDMVDFDFRVLTQDEMVMSENVPPEDGAYISGLFIDGARWDEETHCVEESMPRELFVSCPYIHLWPRSKTDIPVTKGRPELYSGSILGTNHIYMTPVYKTSVRQGTLSTTGHSTNFVMFLSIPMAKHHEQKHWIKRGLAILTQLDD